MVGHRVDVRTRHRDHRVALALASHRVLVVLGYDSIYEAADHVPELLRFDLIGLEGFDARLVEQMRHANLNVENLRLLPEGEGWILAEVGAESAAQAELMADELVQSLPSNVRTVTLLDEADQDRVWRVRESGPWRDRHIPRAKR